MTDTDDTANTDDKPATDLQLIPLAFERARVIVEQNDNGMLQGSVSPHIALLVSRGVLALTKLLEADTDEIARLVESETRLEEERNDALTRARAAEAEQLPVLWFWSTVPMAAARLVLSDFVCQANLNGGALQMIGHVPDSVQTACLARAARLKNSPPPVVS